MKNVIAALTEGFAEVEPGVTVSYDPTGSGCRHAQRPLGKEDVPRLR